MPEMLTIPREEWETLQKRARKLAGDKSYLQLLVNMMQQLGSVAGLENVADAMPRIVMENIGGTNLILYYFIDQDIHRSDLYGNHTKLDTLDDPEVRRAMDSREMAEYQLDADKAQMQELALPHAWTWVFPLLVGTNLIGVFKIENVHINTQEWRKHLPTFFNYAALILKNEILGHSRLQKAYQELEGEVEVRQQVEEELRTTNEELQLKLDTLLLPDMPIEKQELRNILNTQELCDLMREFNHLSQVATAIIDLKGDVLVGIGWQNICTKFHRIHPQTLQNCRESDLVLTRGILEGQCQAYQCKNHLWDVSTPLFIGGKHVANIFVGQFFYEDTPPDLDLFARQADHYGFDKDAYLTAIKQVPLCSREKIAHLMAFYGKFATLISKLSFSNLKLAKSLLDNKRIEDELRHAKEDLELTVTARTAELRKSTEELDQFFTLALDLLCIADTNGNFLRLNLEWERTLGFQRNELLARKFLEFVHPDDQASTLEAVTQLAAQQEVVGFTNRYRRKDGEYRWLEWRATPVGNLIYSAARDITEHLQTEKTLRENSEFLERVFATTKFLLAYLDTQFNFIRVNQAYAQTEQQPPEFFIGRNHFDLYPNAENESIFRRVTETGEPVSYNAKPFEYPDQPELGISYWDWDLYPVKNKSGKVEGLLLVLLDVSERKKAEEALFRLNQTLENRVQEELSKNREKDLILIQQSRLAAMGEMVHNIAHQWRQPLNALGLILANIKDAYAYNDLSETFLEEETDTGRKLIDRMSKTIDDFRDFFRPDRAPHQFAVCQSIEDALSVMEASLKNNFIQIEKHLVTDLQANGFDNQFAQVVLNLLANAKEAILQSGETNGRIILDLREEHGMGILTVGDNGGGIPADVLPRVFDPYFTTKAQGSGIGLYMSKMIIERNFLGQIEAHNSGDGALFTVTLPLASGGISTSPPLKSPENVIHNQ